MYLRFWRSRPVIWRGVGGRRRARTRVVATVYEWIYEKTTGGLSVYIIFIFSGDGDGGSTTTTLLLYRLGGFDGRQRRRRWRWRRRASAKYLSVTTTRSLVVFVGSSQLSSCCGTTGRACLHDVYDNITITIYIYSVCVFNVWRLNANARERCLRRVRRAHTDRKRHSQPRDTYRGAARLQAVTRRGTWRYRYRITIVGGGPRLWRCLINGDLVGPATRVTYTYVMREIVYYIEVFDNTIRTIGGEAARIRVRRTTAYLLYIYRDTARGEACNTVLARIVFVVNPKSWRARHGRVASGEVCVFLYV